MTTPIGKLARLPDLKNKTFKGPLLTVLGALLLSSSMVSWAHAAPPDAVVAVAVSKGEKLLRERNFTAAIAAFEQAYRLRPYYMFQCSIARCDEGMHRVVEAVDHYRRCLKEGGEKTKMAGQIKRALKHAEAQITWITVLSPGEGALLNSPASNKARRQLPFNPGSRLPLNPGSHQVSVQKPGTKPAKFTLRTLPGEPVAMALIPLVPGATLSLKQAKQAPSLLLPKPPPRLKPSHRRLSPIWFWTTVALTTALLGASTALGIQTLQQRSEYEGNPTKAGYESFANLRLSTNILFTLMGVAAGSSTVLFFYSDFGGGGANGGPQKRRSLSSLGTWQGRF